MEDALNYLGGKLEHGPRDALRSIVRAPRFAQPFDMVCCILAVGIDFSRHLVVLECQRQLASAHVRLPETIVDVSRLGVPFHIQFEHLDRLRIAASAHQKVTEVVDQTFVDEVR